MKQSSGIQVSLFDYFLDEDMFTLKDAEQAVIDVLNKDVKIPSIRARLYEGIEKGLFNRVGRGIYSVRKGDSTCLLIQGNGRDISFMENDSVDFIITDHPYDLKSNKGGNRNFADYECFRYEKKDFQEKLRVLKNGCFLVEFLPEKNAVNRSYLNLIEDMALDAGFLYYANVDWKKGTEKHNVGRKVKNKENILFLTKGKARLLRRDAKKEKDDFNNAYYMSGAKKMLPTEFDYQPPSSTNRIHQAEKPIELIKEIIDLISVEKELGLDQFAGSGVSGEAALELNRDMILIEKDSEALNNIINKSSIKGRGKYEKIR